METSIILEPLNIYKYYDHISREQHDIKIYRKVSECNVNPNGYDKESTPLSATACVHATGRV